MPDPLEQRASMFPKLDAAQIARLEPFGHRRRASAGEVLFDQGETNRALFVVIEGSIEIVAPAVPAVPSITNQPRSPF